MMETWNKLNKPPLTALKVIGAGRLKGKSDINPQWRYQALTEVFGICGIGWKYTIDRLWTEPGPHEQVFAFANVSLYVRVDGEWSEAIPGNGGSKMVDKESAGLYSNDEAFKMAITDALGTAAKMIGVAAEIYLGNFDGSKYVDRSGGVKDESKLDTLILKKIDECTTMEALSDVWNSINTGLRHGYTAYKDAAKKRIGDQA